MFRVQPILEKYFRYEQVFTDDGGNLETSQIFSSGTYVSDPYYDSNYQPGDFVGNSDWWIAEGYPDNKLILEKPQVFLMKNHCMLLQLQQNLKTYFR